MFFRPRRETPIHMSQGITRASRQAVVSAHSTSSAHSLIRRLTVASVHRAAAPAGSDTHICSVILRTTSTTLRAGCMFRESSA
jgi:hypothetical protein